MDISIIPSLPKYLRAYTHLVQQAYLLAYVSPELGLTEQCFSEFVFNTPDSQAYLKSNLINSLNQTTWLAFFGPKLVGSITLLDKDESCELKGFYVMPDYQGQGIGSQLYKTFLSKAGNKEITLDLYSHNRKAISIYQHWDFEIDQDKGRFMRRWPEWPEGVQAECLYMKRKA